MVDKVVRQDQIALQALYVETSPGVFEPVLQVGINGAAKVSGLAGNFVRHTGIATYNTTDVLGFQILKAAGTLRLSPKDGGADVTLDATEVVNLGFTEQYKHCDEIQTDAAGMEMLLFIG